MVEDDKQQNNVLRVIANGMIKVEVNLDSFDFQTLDNLNNHIKSNVQDLTDVIYDIKLRFMDLLGLQQRIDKSIKDNLPTEETFSYLELVSHLRGENIFAMLLYIDYIYDGSIDLYKKYKASYQGYFQDKANIYSKNFVDFNGHIFKIDPPKKGERKYRILEDDTIVVDDVTLYRIEAIRSFSNVPRGTLGGYIQAEKNLSHEGNCWIYNDAKAMDNSKVMKNGKMYNLSCIKDNARLLGNSKMYNNSIMKDFAVIKGEVYLYDNTKVSNNAKLSGLLDCNNNTKICGNAIIVGEEGSYIGDDSLIGGNVKLSGYISYPDGIILT